jgi:DNA-binding response OmpR family regulator
MINMAQILIVDDDAAMRRLLTVTLSHQWMVREAWDGEIALDWVRRYQPRVVLVALSLPGSLSGLDLLQAIKTHSSTQSIRVVALADRVDAVQQRLAQEGGADAYFMKPLNPNQLKHWIQTHC